MKVIYQGQDLYDRVIMCNRCGCVFHTTRDDVNVLYHDNFQKTFFECPSCYLLIPVETNAFWLFKKEDNKNDNG